MRSYEALPQGLFHIFIMYILLTIGTIVSSIIAFYYGKVKKLTNCRQLGRALMTFVGSSIWYTISFGEAFFSGWKKEIYFIGFSLGTGLFVLGILYYSLFFARLFTIPANYMVKYKIWFVFLAILTALPNNYYGYPPEAEGLFGPSIRVFSNVLYLISAIYIHTRIYRYNLHRIPQSLDKIERIGLRLIGFSQFAMIAGFFCIIIDVILFTFGPDPTGFSMFILFALGFFLLFILNSFFALIIPAWLHKYEVPSQLLSTETYFYLSRFEAREIYFHCPLCNTTREFTLQNEILLHQSETKGIIFVALGPNIACEHSLILGIDRNFEVRSVTIPDYQITNHDKDTNQMP